jgi:hypothetical protein
MTEALKEWRSIDSNIGIGKKEGQSHPFLKRGWVVYQNFNTFHKGGA